MTHLKFKRHYKLLLLLALVAAVLIVGFGDQPIVAYSLQGTEQVTGAVITYGHSLATLVGAVPDSSQIPGTVQASSLAGSE
jgi:hypothetical protein